MTQEQIESALATNQEKQLALRAKQDKLQNAERELELAWHETVHGVKAGSIVITEHGKLAKVIPHKIMNKLAAHLTAESGPTPEWFSAAWSEAGLDDYYAKMDVLTKAGFEFDADGNMTEEHSDKLQEFLNGRRLKSMTLDEIAQAGVVLNQ